MKVRVVYRPGAVYATAGESLREAAQKMRSSGQSCLPVLEGARLLGIITERDLVEAVANGVPPAEGCVVDYVNDGSITVGLDDECSVAELKMLAIGCRNLPVVNQGRLVGMVSMRDVILRTAAYEAFSRLHRRTPAPAG